MSVNICEWLKYHFWSALHNILDMSSTIEKSRRPLSSGFETIRTVFMWKEALLHVWNTVLCSFATAECDVIVTQCIHRVIHTVHALFRFSVDLVPMKFAHLHDDVIKWKHFPRYWSFVRGIHRSPVNSPHKGQWRGASMFTLICARINGWINNGEAGDLRRNRAHYDVIVMLALFADTTRYTLLFRATSLVWWQSYTRTSEPALKHGEINPDN